jgi:hypothetical protein
MKFNVKALAVVMSLSAGVVPVLGGAAVAAETAVTVELSQELASVVRAAATNPSAEMAQAQINTLIADNPALAGQIAVLAATLRPEIALGVAKAAAAAQPDAAVQIFAAVDAAAPGQGIADAAGEFVQASGRPMNFGLGPQSRAPFSTAGRAGGGGGGGTNVVIVEKTVPGPSLSGP